MHDLITYFELALESTDGIKKLRQMILTLAMQGKLVKQDPNDQPASELLKEIQAEKERLVKEGKIKTQKSLPQIRPEEVPYPVPKGWEWVRLSAVGEINPRNYFDDNNDAGFVPMPLINADYHLNHTYMVKKWRDIKKGYTHFADGDIGLAKITPCFENGKSCVFRNLPNGIGAGTTELHVFRNSFRAIHAEYLLAYIKNPSFIQNGVFRMTGSAGQKRVPVEYFADNPFPIPPLAEQKRIVAKIDQLMALCDTLETQKNARDRKKLAVHTAAMNSMLSATDQKKFHSSWQFITRNFNMLYTAKENVAELKKAILTLAMQGKLVKQDPNDQPASELLKEIQAEKERLVKEGKIKAQKPLPQIKPEEVPYPVPKGWEWVRLGEISIKIHYGFTASANEDYQEIRLLRITDIQNNQVNWESVPGCLIRKNEIAQYQIHENDILIARTGGTIGKTYLVKKIPVKAVFASYLIRVIPPTNFHVDYLKYYLESPLYWKQLYAASSGTGQPNVNGTSLSELNIPFPPLAEQKRIVAKIDQLMALCEKMEGQIEKATEIRGKLFDALRPHPPTPSPEGRGGGRGLRAF